MLELPITITSFSSPLGEFSIERDESHKTISFGRAAGCDVKFAPDATNISRYHLALELRTDRYFITTQSDNPVYVNGARAHDGDELPIGRSRLALGSASGPTFSILTSSVHDDLPATDPSYRADLTPREVASRSVWVAGASVIAVFVVGGVLWAWLGMQSITLDEQFSQLAQKYTGENSEDTLAEKLIAARESVYLVALRSGEALTPIGTGWVVGTGMLATNAHVADAIENSVDTGRFEAAVVVANEAPFSQLKVTSWIAHPHYDSFQKHQERTLLDETGQEIRLVPGYDVALLHIASEDSDLLNDPLPIAPTKVLQELDAGIPVGFVGYPLELAAGGGTNPNEPTPQLQSGRITSVTDMFMNRGDADTRHLVQHNLPGAGGASGSPILNENGEVVALFNAGNVVGIEEKRISTGIGINFGQRADLLQELIQGDADQRGNQREAYWGKRVARYQTPLSILKSQWTDEAATEGFSELIIKQEETVGLNHSHRANNIFVFTIDLANPIGRQAYFFGAESHDGSDIDVILSLDGSVIQSNTKPDSWPYIFDVIETSDLPSGAKLELHITAASEVEAFDYSLLVRSKK